MKRNIFVNLPVKNLEATQTFFSALGFSYNAQFTNETAACMVIEDNIFAMLITEPYFQTFTPQPIADARASTEVLIALSCQSRAEVESMVKNAVAAGGNTYNEAKDHGFMYQHGFQDLDGHIWEVMWMNPDYVMQQ